VSGGLNGDPAGRDLWELDGGTAALGVESRATTLVLAPSAGLATAVAGGANSAGR
jgi:hypothetical protein